MTKTLLKRIVLFTALMQLILQVSAQNAQIEFPVITKKSIIREYSDQVDIIYNDNNSFLYVDRGSGFVIGVQLPTAIEVTDMEIVGDTLYFCGFNGNSNYFCLLDIPGTFLGSSQITMIQIPFYPVDTYNNIPFPGIFKLTKIEVQARNLSSPQDLHIYMIGTVEFNTGLYHPVKDYSCIIDAGYDGSNWYINIASEPGRVYHFNDLTITDNYLWIVGNKHEATGEYMHGFILSTFGNSTTLNSPISSTVPPLPSSTIEYWYPGDIDYYPISRQLIETISDDTVAIACYGMIGNSTPAIIISLYYVGPMVNLINWYYFTNVTATDEFQDLKYNPTSNYLFLAPDHTCSVITDHFYCFDLSSYTVNLWASQFPEVHSLDYMHGNNGALLSSNTEDQNLGEWRFFPVVDECASTKDLQVKKYYEQIFKRETPIVVRPFDYIATNIQPQIFAPGFEVRCGEIRTSVINK